MAINFPTKITTQKWLFGRIKEVGAKKIEKIMVYSTKNCIFVD
jgi:hypothetical protein